MESLNVVWDGVRGWSDRYGDAGQGLLLVPPSARYEIEPVAVDLQKHQMLRFVGTEDDPLLRSIPSAWATIQEVVDLSGKSYDRVRKGLKQLEFGGFVERRLESEKAERGKFIRLVYRRIR